MKDALRGKRRARQIGRRSATTKVLYIEHDDDNLYMLKRRLERCSDFEVLAAEAKDTELHLWRHRCGAEISSSSTICQLTNAMVFMTRLGWFAAAAPFPREALRGRVG